MFEERFKDIKVEEVIIFPDSWQVNGHDLDGRKVWILLQVPVDGIKVRMFQAGFNDED
jgi:hypothetical protein